MRIDPERVSQATESKDIGLIPFSLLRLIESRVCSGGYPFDFAHAYPSFNAVA